jgi:hypothetical protein
MPFFASIRCHFLGSHPLPYSRAMALARAAWRGRFVSKRSPDEAAESGITVTTDTPGRGW